MTAMVGVAPSADSPLLVDRYAIYDAIAAGGMATVHLGRLVGSAGFLRTVAVKRLHAQYAHDADFTSMLLDEARLAARIQHPNVVSTLDVVLSGNELLLVMDYVRGESLSRLMRRARERDERAPPRVVVAIIAGTLNGLHAAHEATNEKGQPLGLIHRDVSPQNVLVGADGIARVLDFGIAKAEGRVSTTQDGKIKGKILYMAPEQLAAETITRTADIYGMGVVLFEALTSVRMFAGENEGAAISKIVRGEIRVPSEIAPELAPFDDVVRKAMALDPAERFTTAAAMSEALEACDTPASTAQVGAWVHSLVGDVLDERARMVAEIERSSTRSKPPLGPPVSGAVKIEVPATPPPFAGPVAPVAMPTEDQASPFVRFAPQRMPVVWGAGAFAVLLIGTLAIVVVFLLITRGNKATDSTTNTKSAATAGSTTETEPSIAAVPTVHVGGGATSANPPASSDTNGATTVGGAAAGTPTVAATTTATATATTTANTTATATATAAATSHVARPAVNCDPPYTIDKNGRKHFIPECMR